jgi:hypothetical protein
VLTVWLGELRNISVFEILHTAPGHSLTMDNGWREVADTALTAHKLQLGHRL